MQALTHAKATQSFRISQAMMSAVAPFMAAHMQTWSPVSPHLSHLSFNSHPFLNQTQTQTARKASVSFIRLAADTGERYDQVIVRLFTSTHQFASTATSPDCKVLITGRGLCVCAEESYPNRGFYFRNITWWSLGLFCGFRMIGNALASFTWLYYVG